MDNKNRGGMGYFGGLEGKWINLGELGGGEGDL